MQSFRKTDVQYFQCRQCRTLTPTPFCGVRRRQSLIFDSASHLSGALGTVAKALFKQETLSLQSTLLLMLFDLHKVSRKSSTVLS